MSYVIVIPEKTSLCTVCTNNHLNNQPTASCSQYLDWEKLVTNTILLTHYIEQCICITWSRAEQRTE